MSTTTESEDGEIEEDSYHPDTFSEGDFQVAGELTGEQRQQLRESLERHGFVPAMGQITVDEDDTIIDGHHRIGECRALGIEIPAEGVRVFEGTWLEKRAEARRLNTESQGRPVTGQLKKDLIEQAITDYDENGEKITDAQIANECGSTQQWASQIRDRMAREDEITTTCILPLEFRKDKARKLIREGTHMQKAIAEECSLSKDVVRDLQKELEQEHKEDSETKDSPGSQTDRASQNDVDVEQDPESVSPSTNGQSETVSTQPSPTPPETDSGSIDADSEPTTSATPVRETAPVEGSSNGISEAPNAEVKEDTTVPDIPDMDLGEYIERLKEIRDDPDVQRRGELWTSLSAHMGIKLAAEDAQCPTCGSGPEKLQWVCCGHDAAGEEVVEKARQASQQSVNEMSEGDRENGA